MLYADPASLLEVSGQGIKALQRVSDFTRVVGNMLKSQS